MSTSRLLPSAAVKSDLRDRLQTSLSAAYTLERELGGGGRYGSTLALSAAARLAGARFGRTMLAWSRRVGNRPERAEVDRAQRFLIDEIDDGERVVGTPP